VDVIANDVGDQVGLDHHTHVSHGLPCKGLTVGRLSREIALDIAESVYRPSLAEHIAGGANTTADARSRLLAPDKKQIPDFLSTVQKAKLPPRNNSFYRTLVHPVAAAWNDKHNAVNGGSVR